MWSGSGLLMLPGGGVGLVSSEKRGVTRKTHGGLSAPTFAPGPRQCRVKERLVCISEQAEVWSGRFFFYNVT